MKKVCYLLIATLSLIISGCMQAPPPQPAPATEPLVFGVPQSAWNTLTNKQKDAAIAAYNQQQQASIQAYNEQQQQQAQNAQVETIVNAASTVLNSAMNKNNSN